MDDYLSLRIMLVFIVCEKEINVFSFILALLKRICVFSHPLFQVVLFILFGSLRQEKKIRNQFFMFWSWQIQKESINLKSKFNQVLWQSEWLKKSLVVLALLILINFYKLYNGEFDPGSGRTLAACLTHASLREWGSNIFSKVAQGWVICK